MVKLITTTFKWSSDEQVYPFKLADDGSALHCKQVYTGDLPNNGTKGVAHSIANFDPLNVYELSGAAFYNVSNPLTNEYLPLPFASSLYPVQVWVQGANIFLRTWNNSPYVDSHINIIYKR